MFWLFFWFFVGVTLMARSIQVELKLEREFQAEMETLLNEVGNEGNW